MKRQRPHIVGDLTRADVGQRVRFGVIGHQWEGVLVLLHFQHDEPNSVYVSLDDGHGYNLPAVTPCEVLTAPVPVTAPDEEGQP